MSKVDSAASERHLATLGRLTRGALHEIANPLLALIASTELALTDLVPGSPARERVETARRTALEIAELVRAMQGFARHASEGPRRLSLAESAEEAVALVRLVKSAPDVEVSARLEAAPHIHAAPAAVTGALVELLLAGVAAAGPGEIVELLVRAEGGDAVAGLADGGELRLRLS